MLQPDIPPLLIVQRHAVLSIAVGDTGVIDVVGTGTWSAEDVDRHFDSLDAQIDDHRAHGIGIRVLVDLRIAGAQCDKTLTRIGTRSRTTYRAGDRIALLVGSSVAKMQMRHIVRSAEHEFFMSERAARLWLTAYDR